jgi:hypothetical protein
VSVIVVLLVVAFVGGVIWHVVRAQLGDYRTRLEADLDARRQQLQARSWKAVRDEAARLRCDRCPWPCRSRMAAGATVDPAVLRLAATLTHPDRHPAERVGEATRVTAQLLSAYRSSSQTSP